MSPPQNFVVDQYKIFRKKMNALASEKKTPTGKKNILTPQGPPRNPGGLKWMLQL